MSKKFQFIKQNQPKFITQFKEKAGLIKGPDLEDKHRPNHELDDREDDEEEQPVIVVLNDGDLTSEEVKKEKDEGNIGGKILFKPASKRSAENKGLSVTSKKSKVDLNEVKKPEKDKTKSKKKAKSKVAPILSFNEEEEDIL
uniref:DUF4604 domain-containing protein n=1 Tax=Ciona savignyi TaxID=51511 RepID=H2YUZ6_CIOSA